MQEFSIVGQQVWFLNAKTNETLLSGHKYRLVDSNVAKGFILNQPQPCVPKVSHLELLAPVHSWRPRIHFVEYFYEPLFFGSGVYLVVYVL